MTKVTWKQVDNFRKYILGLELNVVDTFAKIGDFRFYSAPDYVSIDEVIDYKWEQVIAIHETTTYNNFTVFGEKSLSREDALAALNAEWDKIDNYPILFKRIKSALKSVEGLANERRAAAKAHRIEKLEHELEELKK
jgi:hypothetical protein